VNFKGVGQEVQEHLLHLPFVAADDPESRVDGAGKPDPAPARPLPHQDQGVVDRGRQVELRQLQLHAPRFDLREIEDVVDEGEEMVSRLEDVLEILGLLLVDVAEHLLGQDLREPDDGVERRAQLVRHVGEKLRLVAVGRLELRVEPAQLVAVWLRFAARVPSSSRLPMVTWREKSSANRRVASPTGCATHVMSLKWLRPT
jgi:hypothetical protein